MRKPAAILGACILVVSLGVTSLAQDASPSVVPTEEPSAAPIADSSPAASEAPPTAVTCAAAFDDLAAALEANTNASLASLAKAKKPKQWDKAIDAFDELSNSFSVGIDGIEFPSEAAAAVDELQSALEEYGRTWAELQAGAITADGLDYSHFKKTQAAIEALRATLVSTEPCGATTDDATPEEASMSPPPSEQSAGASAARTLDDLLAPMDEAPSRDAVLGLYEPIGSMSLQVIDFSKREPSGRTPDAVEMPTSVHTEPGTAARLCAFGSAGETEQEKTLDRQRGCFLAIASEWIESLRAETPADAVAHYDAARAVLGLASTTLDERGFTWLQTALRKQLPETLDQVPKASLKGRKGKAKTQRLLSQKSRKTSGESLLRSIRDAQVANLPFVMAHFGREKGAWDDWEMLTNLGWEAVHIKKDARRHVTRPAICIHDLRSLEKVPKKHDTSGSAFVYEPELACWELVEDLWAAYRTTGSREYLRAAEQAWAMLWKVDPGRASQIAKTGRWNEYYTRLR